MPSTRKIFFHACWVCATKSLAHINVRIKFFNAQWAVRMHLNTKWLKLKKKTFSVPESPSQTEFKSAKNKRSKISHLGTLRKASFHPNQSRLHFLKSTSGNLVWGVQYRDFCFFSILNKWISSHHLHCGKHCTDSLGNVVKPVETNAGVQTGEIK